MTACAEEYDRFLTTNFSAAGRRNAVEDELGDVTALACRRPMHRRQVVLPTSHAAAI